MPHKPYRLSDVQVVWSRGDFQGWDDMLAWLRRDGEQDNELRADEVNHMIADVERAKDDGKPMPHDPRKIYEVIHES